MALVRLGGQVRELALHVQIQVEASITALLVNALESAGGGGRSPKMSVWEVKEAAGGGCLRDFEDLGREYGKLLSLLKSNSSEEAQGMIS